MRRALTCLAVAVAAPLAVAQDPWFGEPVTLAADIPGTHAPIHGSFVMTDVDGDGDLDVLMGTERLVLLRNEGEGGRPRFAEPEPVLAGGEPIAIEPT